MAVTFNGGGHRSTQKKPTNLSQVIDKLYHTMLYLPHLDLNGFELTTLVVTDMHWLHSSCKSNYHTIMTATALVSAICGFAGSCDYREKNTAPVSFGVQLGVDTLYDCHLFEINPEGYRVVLNFFQNKLLNIQSNSVPVRFLNAICFFFLWWDSKPHYW